MTLNFAQSRSARLILLGCESIYSGSILQNSTASQKECMRYGFTKPSRPHSSEVRQVQEYNAATAIPHRPPRRINPHLGHADSAVGGREQVAVAQSCERPERHLAPSTRMYNVTQKNKPLCPHRANASDGRTDTGGKHLCKLPPLICRRERRSWRSLNRHRARHHRHTSHCPVLDDTF